MGKKWSFAITATAISLLLPVLLIAQPINFQYITTTPLASVWMTTDNLRQAYVVQENGAVLKIGADGRVLAEFSKKRWGKPTLISADNPMKILLFYPDFNHLVILSQDFGVKAQLELSRQGYAAISAIALSRDNNIWIYDDLERRLIKIDDQLREVSRSDDIQTKLGTALKPVFLQEHENLLYVSDPAIGILVFDQYLSYIKTIPYKGVNQFQFHAGNLVFFQHNTLHTYNLRTLAETSLPLPDVQEIRTARIEKDRLFLLRKNDLLLYAF